METWIDCEETWIVLQGVAFAPIDCNHEFMLGLTTRNLYVAVVQASAWNLFQPVARSTALSLGFKQRPRVTSEVRTRTGFATLCQKYCRTW